MNVVRMFGSVCSVRKRVRVFRFRTCSDACSAERVQDLNVFGSVQTLFSVQRTCSDCVQCSDFLNVFRFRTCSEMNF